MRTYGFARLLQNQQRSIGEMVTEVATSKSEATLRSAAVLAEVCRGVITGEGPAAAGRVHFSRTIDAEDTALCARILIFAGQGGEPVSRAEADALFDIDAVAGERRDGGRFDDLLAKAVVHYLMSACGHYVPGRETALAPVMPLDDWASAIDINTELRFWLERRLWEMNAGSLAAPSIMKVIAGAEPPQPQRELQIATLFDMAT